MKKEKLHIVSLFHLNANIAGKDMFLVPMYLGQHLGASVELVYPKAEFNKEFVGEYRGVKLTPIRSKSKYYSTFWSEKEMGWWLIKNARKIDVLCLFWLNPRNAVFARIYKFLNPRGVCYIKGDFNENHLTTIQQGKGRLKSSLKQLLFKKIDVLSAETVRSTKLIKEGLFGGHLSEQVVYMPNAFDEELCKQQGVVRKSFEQKENLIISIGRIGTLQKNSQMMLRIMDGMDMKGWKFIFTGPVEDSFRNDFEQFLTSNPEKKASVLMVGLVDNKQELWEYYNRAKVFMLTSIFEGFANVFAEALYFGNYIFSTKVGGAYEVSDNEKIGKIADISDEVTFKEHLSEIVEGKIDLASNYTKACALSDKQFIWRKTIEPVAQRIREVYDAKHS